MLWKIVVILLIVQWTQSTCPNSCICNHEHIDCSSRQLTSLPDDLPSEFLQERAFNNPHFPDTSTSFTTLNLANNQLQGLPTSLLSEKLPNLQHLDLSNNKIQEVTNVQSIVLSKQLLYLKISSNPIRHLGLNTDTVLYSQSISHLDVANCAISSIRNPESFNFMLNLTSLIISGNPLIVVDHLTSATLNHLDLSQCLLGDGGIREETFLNLPKLKSLNLSMNAHFTKFSISKPLSSSLLHLEASYCALEKINLRSFPKLQHGILKGNVIKILSNYMLSDNLHLQSLDISENSIHHIEENAFMGSNSLRKLDLSLNLLSNLDWNVFLNTPRLEILNISRNLLTTLIEIPIPSLTTLDASKCEILKLGPQFLAKPHELRYLNLSYNSIEKLPKLQTTKKLLYFDVSFCRISEIQDDTFQGLSSSLINLNLMGNRLTTPMKESAFEHFVNLNEVNLLNNPWHCNCYDKDFKKLWKYLSSYPVKTKHLKSLLCHFPNEYHGMSWENSCFEHFNAEEGSSKNKTWLSFMVPFLSLCCLLAIMIVIRQAYTARGQEEQRESDDQRRQHQNREYVPRTAPHYFDDDLERGIQMSINESTQRSTIRELSKLPSYEEALLLPKPQSREDLQKIMKKYEENDRFERSAIEETHQPERPHSYDEITNFPSTSDS